MYLRFIHVDKFYILILITIFHFMDILHWCMFKSFPKFCYYNVHYLALLHVRLYLGYIPRNKISWLKGMGDVSITLFELLIISLQSDGICLYSHQHPTFSPSHDIHQIQKQIWQNLDGRYVDVLCYFLYFPIHFKYSIIKIKMFLWFPTFISDLNKDLEFLLVASAHVTDLLSKTP